MQNNESRIHNSIRNVSIGMLGTIVNAIVFFVTRTVLVKELGPDVLGLNGLFSDVINMISLAELGFGMAITYNLYKPISENDTIKINKLINFYRTVYIYIFFITIVIGAIVSIFIDKLIIDLDYSLSYIRLVFLIFVIKTAFSYMFSYKISLLNADQKQFIIVIFSVSANVIFNIIIVITLACTKSFILYLVLQILQTLSINLALTIYANKTYGFFKKNDYLDKNEKKIIFGNVKDIFLRKIAGVITTSTDSILISSMISTRLVGLYSNYVIVFAMIKKIRNQLMNGMTASIGNLMVSGDNEKCILVLRRLTFIFFSFSCFITSGLFAVLDTFIELWIGREYLLEGSVVFILVLYLYFDICSEPLWQFLEVSGLFKIDKYIGIIGSVVNLIASIILCKKIGMRGIFCGTIISLFLQIILKTLLLFKLKFMKSYLSYLSMWLKIIIGFYVLYYMNLFIKNILVFHNPYVSFIVLGTTSTLISLIVIFILFGRQTEYDYSFKVFKSILSSHLFH